MSGASDKTPKGFLNWILYMRMVQDLVYSVCRFGFFSRAIIDEDLRTHMSQFCAIYDLAITFKYNEGSDYYNNVMRISKTVEDETVLGGLATTKIPTNQKFRNSTSGVNVMNPLAPHECKPSFSVIMLICYKCYLTAVLLYDKGADGGVAILMRRSYIGNTSAKKMMTEST